MCRALPALRQHAELGRLLQVTNEHIYMVCNAGCRDKDLAHIGAHLKDFQACTPRHPSRRARDRAQLTHSNHSAQAKGGDARWHIHDERGLLALQGPKAAAALQARSSSPTSGAAAYTHEHSASSPLTFREQSLTSAAHLLQTMTKFDLSKFYFGSFAFVNIAGIECYLTRTGYTGEDGFEISIPNEGMLPIAQQLVKADGVKLSGARP